MVPWHHTSGFLRFHMVSWWFPTSVKVVGVFLLKTMENLKENSRDTDLRSEKASPLGRISKLPTVTTAKDLVKGSSTKCRRKMSSCLMERSQSHSVLPTLPVSWLFADKQFVPTWQNTFACISASTLRRIQKCTVLFSHSKRSINCACATMDASHQRRTLYWHKL